MPAHHESDSPVNASRPDDEDHDLLTFGEAGARLIEELAEQERRLGRLREAGASADEIGSAEQRLDALRRAQQRNRQPSLDDLRASGFFGRR